MARYRVLHRWDLTPTEAVALQRELRTQIRIEPLNTPVRTIAGTDLSFDKGSDVVFAGVVVLELPELRVVEQVCVKTRAHFPYIPGLFSFRELPPLIDVWARVRAEPDAVMLDGHGYAHPRRMGLASHAGLVFDRPTVGCAKTVLVGKYDEPPPSRGCWRPIVHKGEIVGAALRTRTGVAPVYVSVGHRIDLEGAIDLVLRCHGGYRIPEPTRRAHLLVNAARRGERVVDADLT